MVRRKRRTAEDGEPNGTWLNTYADMVTLLLTFFAVMLSLSSVNEEKFNAFIQSMRARTPEVTVEENGPGDSGQGGVGTPGQGSAGVMLGSVDDLEQLYFALDQYVNEEGMQSDVQLTLQNQVLYIRFSSSLLFQPDSALLQPDVLPVLDRVAGALLRCESQIERINVCGYTAEVTTPGYGVSSWTLSGERAAAVADYLNNDKGFPADKLIAMGYGKTNPVGDNATPEGRQANRRVELVVIGNGGTLDLEGLQGLYDENTYPTFGGTEDVLDPGAAPPSGAAVTAGTEHGEIETGVSPYDD